MSEKEPRIIIETDIGDDIDDVWSLVYALRHFGSRIALVNVVYGDIPYKVLLVSKILHILGFNALPIGLGKTMGNMARSNQAWIGSDQQTAFSNPLLPYEQAMDQILATEESAILFELGPANDLAAYLKNRPSTRKKLTIAMMGGAYHQGYLNQKEPAAEYNVLCSIEATNFLFASCPSFVLLPLDVCRDVFIKGADYQDLLAHEEKPFVRVILENYRIWQRDYQGGAIKFDPCITSSILYDLVVPLFLAYPASFTLEKDHLLIDAKGNTLSDPNAPLVTVATQCHAFPDLIHTVAEELWSRS